MFATTGMLPGGYWDAAGKVHRDFELSVLTGRDEEELAQTGRAESASLVSAVLSRAMRRLGSISPVTEDVSRSLSVADRQYLLLKLRQCTFGDMVHSDLFCPWPNCGRRISLEFSINDFPVEEPKERAPFYSVVLSPPAIAEADGRTPPSSPTEVCFRLPNGADQEALSPLLENNEAHALTLLLARTVQSIGHVTAPEAGDLALLSSAARAEIEAAMERVSPKVELDIETACPDCGRGFVVPFDLQRFFFGELRSDLQFLYHQVHYLAYHYHWGEGEIMTMPGSKRERYVELLADEIERENHGE